MGKRAVALPGARANRPYARAPSCVRSAGLRSGLACPDVRAASPEPLRFALLEALTNRFVGAKSAEKSTFSDQASPRYNKR